MVVFDGFSSDFMHSGLRDLQTDRHAGQRFRRSKIVLIEKFVFNFEMFHFKRLQRSIKPEEPLLELIHSRSIGGGHGTTEKSDFL